MDRWIVFALATVVSAVLVVGLLLLKLRRTTAQLAEARSGLQRFAPIADVEAQVASVQRDLETLKVEREAFVAADERRQSELNARYQEAHATFLRLRSEVASLEENLEEPRACLERASAHARVRAEEVRGARGAACDP
jgi:predicted nuclease with TOPRIM domain